MVDTSVTKYHLVPSDLTSNLSIFRTRKRSSVLLYAVILVFVVFTIFISFTPSSSYSSYWFMNVFTVNSTSPTRSPSPSLYSYLFPVDDDQVDPTSSISPSQGRNFDPNSHVGEVLGDPSSSNLSKDGKLDPNSHVGEVLGEPSSSNLSKDGKLDPNSHVGEVLGEPSSSNLSKDGKLDPNSHVGEVLGEPSSSNLSKDGKLDPTSHVGEVLQGSALRNLSKDVSKNSTGTTIDPITSQNVTKSQTPNSSSSLSGSMSATNTSYMTKSQTPNLSSSPVGKKNSTSIEVVEEKGEKQSINATSIAQVPVDSPTDKKQGDLIEALVDCDLYDGEWVRDETYPLYKPGSCSLIDEQFDCIKNGRLDNDYHKLKWKPKGCTLPRLDGDRMLKFMKGKRLVFVGDSLNRNMWESLVCILRNSVKNKKKVYEAFGRHSFRTEASYSFVFKDYNFTVEFFVAPFIVQQWDFKEKNGETKETLRLDLMVRDNDQFKDADFVVFNTGHWWTHDKTSKGEDYYQEGSHVYKQLDVNEAFRRAITTWARWVDANINPDKTHVLFRGYSASHFSGGQWNSGGQCDSETEPIKNDTYLTPYPQKMTVLESIIKAMKTPVSYLNVTKMTDYRKDGHPSIYRKQHITSEDERRSPLKYQDCSHWCLPGVPDSWNELLYAELLRKQFKDRQQQKNRS